MAISREEADTFALKALEWLARNDELLPVFLGATGASLGDLRENASDPGFLASVLDFVLMDDAWVISMCDAMGVAYETPRQIRSAFPGREEVHWT